MKEIFEKIVLDSVNTVKDGIADEIKSSCIKKGNENFPKIYERGKQEYNNSIEIINAHGRNKRINIMVAGARLSIDFLLVDAYVLQR